MNQAYLHHHHFRMSVIHAIRQFFLEQNFQEFICPILLDRVPAEPTIYPFSTTWHSTSQDQTLFLPISPEKMMKHYLAAGAGNCFTIGHCFRNLEAAGATHHPEFLMLEWYRLDATYHDIMTDVRTLLDFIRQQVATTAAKFSHWQTLSVATLWQDHFGVSLGDLLTPAQLFPFAQQHGYTTTHATWEQIFNQIWLNEIESNLPATPFFLIDFPAQLSPLCRPRPDQTWLAERFEVYWQQLELANGNTEQLDSTAVATAFRTEIATRQQRGLITSPLDHTLISDIKSMSDNQHTYAGVGLGVDRLAMLLSGSNSISQLWPEFTGSSPAD
jgi:lysyl-tRNA synthetase class 2